MKIDLKYKARNKKPTLALTSLLTLGVVMGVGTGSAYAQQASRVISISETPVNSADTPSDVDAENQGVKITVLIENISYIEGQVMIGLYDTAEGFKSETEVGSKVIAVKKSTIVASFEGLTAGDYALKIFHDRDGDGKLDKNILGVPSEPFAFSNGAKGALGVPKWKKVKFNATTARTLARLDLD